MAVERQRWVPASGWEAANARLRRIVEVLDISARVAPLTAASSLSVPLTYPTTVVEVDTAAGAVALQLPPAADHPGFTVTVLRTAGTADVTVNGTNVRTPGQWVSTGSAWVRVLRDIPPAGYTVVVANVTGTVALAEALSIIESDTTAGAVTVTLPAAAAHPGYRVDVVKTGGGNTLTVEGATVAAYGAWISTGAAWRRVG
jgi:hypothetical protein